MLQIDLTNATECERLFALSMPLFSWMIKDGRIFGMMEISRRWPVRDVVNLVKQDPEAEQLFKCFNIALPPTNTQSKGGGQ